MQVTVMIVWNLKQEKAQECYKVIFDLRAGVMRQPGYLSSETLQDPDNPMKVIVLSKWENVDSWREWLASPERRSLAAKIENCLESPTEYQVFTALRLREKLTG